MDFGRTRCAWLLQALIAMFPLGATIWLPLRGPRPSQARLFPPFSLLVFQFFNELFFVIGDHIVRLKTIFYVHAFIALGEVSDVTVTRFDYKIFPQITFNGLGFLQATRR